MNKQQQKVGGQAGESPYYCSLHPSWELVAGVCAHCLKERLLLLLLNGDELRRRTSSISSSLPKVLALGSSFLQRIDSRHHHQQQHGDCYSDDEDTTSAASLDDSFISIKFEDNGKATWDKARSLTGNKKAAAAVRTVVVADQHVRQRGGVTRWRKQVVGRLLQLARWKRSATDKSTKAAAERSSKARGRGWINIRTLTRRRPPWSSS